MPGTALEVFRFPETGAEIRVVVVDGEPTFVIADVCRLLGIANASQAAGRIDADDLSDVEVVDSRGRKQQVKAANESGLYDLIFMSRKAEAKRFKRWVTTEVLPSIRKTGAYSISPSVPAQRSPMDLDMSTPEGRLAVAELLLEGARREIAIGIERDQAKAELAVVAPKAAYVDDFVDPLEDTSTIKDFGRQLQMAEGEIRAYLVERDIIFKRKCWRTDSRGKHVLVWQWTARPKYVKWFTSKDQPEAPRLHNGQMQQTLYINPLGKTKVKELMRRKPPAGWELALIPRSDFS
jgi:anti-repressor protein